ncbi:hypothetical protein MCOR02_003849 [Pyricularia oryzae]|uniref:FAD-binding PCMH-type domain-containing protein n=1 Tax=Pyricularia oryzae TaxID=318829 RepID=A0A4P7N4G9_PYROR|nr:hypothetical protein MCOR02_003849 [Pyricularia oryzae]KAI6319154.1 hypothetical protein MCOR30_008708 [Pyricularia oryzae]KAI6471466.1 hypothetical protein MCOR17_003173 [Pyricularia oryzae]KAI6506798.1 hypothetical protein MCOR13_003131 [Pyricularia oryzae]KAI6578266.1 hypothetical protein MCOR06_010710 [Pyricularia oryzae]
MHRVTKAVVLAALTVCTALASPLSKIALLNDCLSTAEVPVDAPGSTDWLLDSTTFNLRLNYTPAAIATPTTIPQIQAAVSCAASAGLKANAKSGGHSYASFGTGGEDGHLVIQLDRMNNVSLDVVNGIATVQGGARLGRVASELYKQGKRAISHGTCPGVGVGGHALHGGYGMSSHMKGLMLDWLVGATVVLANSSVVECSSVENTYLFWAIRGAGSSMGVVAEMRFETFEAPDEVTYFIAQVPWKNTTAVDGFRALQEFAAEQMPAELNMRLFITRQFANLEGMYWGNKTGLQQTLAPLVTATGAKLQYSQTDNWLGQLTHFGNGLNLDQSRPYKMAETFYSSSLYTHALESTQIQAFVDYWFNKGKATRRDWYVQVDLHGGKNSAVSRPGSDSAAYAHRNHLLLFLFYDRVDTKGVYPSDGFAFIDEFVGDLTKTIGEDDGETWGRYPNYPDSRLSPESAQRGYWGSHLQRLREIKTAVDPGDMFHYPQGVPPAV